MDQNMQNISLTHLQTSRSKLIGENTCQSNAQAIHLCSMRHIIIRNFAIDLLFSPSPNVYVSCRHLLLLMVCLDVQRTHFSFVTKFPHILYALFPTYTYLTCPHISVSEIWFSHCIFALQRRRRPMPMWRNRMITENRKNIYCRCKLRWRRSVGLGWRIWITWCEIRNWTKTDVRMWKQETNKKKKKKYSTKQRVTGPGLYASECRSDQCRFIDWWNPFSFIPLLLCRGDKMNTKTFCDACVCVCVLYARTYQLPRALDSTHTHFHRF